MGLRNTEDYNMGDSVNCWRYGAPKMLMAVCSAPYVPLPREICTYMFNGVSIDNP